MTDNRRAVALIVTALPVESAAVARHFAELNWDRHKAGNRYRVGEFHGRHLTWRVVLAEVGRGNEAAAVAMERAVEHFGVDVALFIGVAGGLKDVAIGDVVVATDVLGYEYGRDEADRFRPRGKQGSSAFPIMELAKQVRIEGTWTARIPGPTASPNVVIEPIAAGSKLVADANSPTAEMIREFYSQAVAVEQEGLGVIAVAASRPRLRVGIIRGVSDLLTGKSASDAAGGQEIAASHAAALGLELLSELEPDDLDSSNSDWEPSSHDLMSDSLAFPVVRFALAINNPIKSMPPLEPRGWDDLTSHIRDRSSRRQIKEYLLSITDVIFDRVLRTALENMLIYESELDSALRTMSTMLSAASDRADEITTIDGAEIHKHFRSALGTQSEFELLDLLVTELASYLAEVLLAEPGLRLDRLAILPDEGISPAELRATLARLPRSRITKSTRRDDAYLVAYLRAVTQKLDVLQIFGIELAQEIRRYSLTTAYISMRTTSSGRLIESFEGDQSVEAALSNGNRFLIRANAGYGKTTCLQWVAVTLARDELPPQLAHWRGCIPFLVRLRKYREKPLPTLEELTLEIAGDLIGEQPADWCREILEAGKAVLLIDGLDEVPSDERHKVQEWLDGLLARWPKQNFLIVTSRPSAIQVGVYDLSKFRTISLAPMGRTQIAKFIEDWHRSTGELVPEAERAAHQARGELLKVDIDRSMVLLELAGTPLLCAVICALNYANPSGLPERRIDLYDHALAMMLGRRDRDRGVFQGEFRPAERAAFLQVIAPWFMINGVSEAPRDKVWGLVEKTLSSYPRLDLTADEVLLDLIERTCVIREIAPGIIDFAHRSFQEYLAAQSFVADGSVGMLLLHASEPDWGNVIALAAGHAGTRVWNELMTGLLNQADEIAGDRKDYVRLQNLVVECLALSIRVEPTLYERALGLLRDRVPPERPDDVKQAVALGPIAVPFLHRAVTSPDTSADQVALCVLAARQMGGVRALAVMEAAARRFGGKLLTLLLESWSYFDPIGYVDRVLSQIPPGRTLSGRLSDTGRIPFTRLLPDNVRLHVEPAVIDNNFPALARQARFTSLALGDPPFSFPSLTDFSWLADVESLSDVSLAGLADFHLERETSPSATIRSLQLDFIHGVPAVLDCSTLLRFPELRALSITGPCRVSNLSALTSLTELSMVHFGGRVEVDWSTERLANPRITELSIVGYDAADLEPISGCTGLHTLSLRYGELMALSGIENMVSLQTLNVSDCGLLADVSALSELDDLVELDLTGCRDLTPDAREFLHGTVQLRESQVALWADPDDDMLGLRLSTLDDVADDVADEYLESFGLEEGTREFHLRVTVDRMTQAERVDAEDYSEGWLVGSLPDIEAPSEEDMTHDQWRSVHTQDLG